MASEQRLEASEGDTGLGREECLNLGQPSLTRLGTRGQERGQELKDEAAGSSAHVDLYGALVFL